MIGLAVLLVIAAMLARAVWKEIADLNRVERQLREYSEAQDRFLREHEAQRLRDIQTLTTDAPIDGSWLSVDFATGDVTYITTQRPVRRPKELTDPDRLAMIREGRGA